MPRRKFTARANAKTAKVGEKIAIIRRPARSVRPGSPHGCDPFTQISMPMTKRHLPGVLLFGLLLLFTGTFTLHGTLLGNTLSGTLLPHRTPSASRADSLARVAADSTREIHRLMALIRHTPRRLPPLPPHKIDTETLWLARCIYSETKRPEEMELVAWVVRNRVETTYRGRDSYRDVVLDPYQFSAFNPGSSKRRLFLNLHAESDAQGWRQALEVAHRVYYSPERERPFPVETRHLYSERSMRGRMQPVWADGETPVQTAGYSIDPRRFRFYSDIW